MAHHAYFLAGNLDEGIGEATRFAHTLGVSTGPDLITLSYTNLTVDDARALVSIEAQAPVEGDKKVIILSATRFFFEAQNALLKLFEEPSPGTTLILVLPSEGVLLPTLRSRLIQLKGSGDTTSAAALFLSLTPAEREKHLSKILERAGGSKEEEKRSARKEMLELVQELTRLLYPKGEKELMKDLSSFTYALHAPAAPLKPIAEHLLLVLPRK